MKERKINVNMGKSDEGFVPRSRNIRSIKNDIIWVTYIEYEHLPQVT